MTAQQTENDASDRSEGMGQALKRRGLIAGAATLVAGIIAKQTGQPVAAIGVQGGGDGQALVITASTEPGYTANHGMLPTMLFNISGGTPAPSGGNLGDAFLAATVNGVGVDGLSNAGTGVQGRGGGDTSTNTTGFPIGVRGSIPNTGYAVYGQAGSGYGVYGTAPGGVGVGGVSTGNTGVSGQSSGNATTKGVYGTHTAGGVGVSGQSVGGYGVVGQGGLAPLHLVPATAGTGAPTTGSHAAGEFYVDQPGALFYCKAAGTPGTWLTLSAGGASPTLVTLPTPERFVDTRSNLGGLQGPVPANTTHTFQMTGRVGQSGNPALIIPDTAKTLIGNLTVVGADGIPLGSFLTLWPSGAQPTVSNINYGPAASVGAIANTFVVGLGSSGGHGVVQVFNLSRCDYLLDVTGYYA